MRQKQPILNCNNSISNNIYHTANVNAAATAAIKIWLCRRDDTAANADTKLHSEIEESEEFYESSAICFLKSAVKTTLVVVAFAVFAEFPNHIILIWLTANCQKLLS